MREVEYEVVGERGGVVAKLEARMAPRPVSRSLNIPDDSVRESLRLITAVAFRGATRAPLVLSESGASKA